MTDAATVTWVLAEEPTPAVLRVIDILEDRVGSTEDVLWVCPVDGPDATR